MMNEPKIVSATHFMRLIRALVLREGEMSDMRFDALWLDGFTVIGIIIASQRFNKHLD